MPIQIQLTARQTGNRVAIIGNGARDLPPGSGAHVFQFDLVDPTGLNVAFSSLDTQDNISTCPPASGQNSNQIVGVAIRPQQASFTDNNSNRNPMDISYQWNFTCNNSAVQVDPFDPIIRNGGTGQL
jgi:hypothetical protein